MFVIVSDLHLGCGDELEDFLRWGPDRAGPSTHLRLRARLELDEAFARFLLVKMAQARGAGMLPTLILLGDIFDIWQSRRARESTHRTLERILSAHVSVRTGLQDWLAAGGEIEFVAGAHDRPALSTRAWAFLRDSFPGLNAANGGRPRLAYSNEALGLYAEHGHRFDPHYRLAASARPDAGCVGREIVRRVLAPLEPIVPWIDKAVALSDIVRLIQSDATPDLRRESFRALASTLHGASFVLHVLSPWLEGGLADWRRLARREESLARTGFERLLRQPSIAGALRPVNRRFVVTAHTHRPARALGDGAIEHLNPGAWKPLVRFDANHAPVIEQTLSYAQLIPDGDGAWEASVRSWATESAAEK